MVLAIQNGASTVYTDEKTDSTDNTPENTGSTGSINDNSTATDAKDYVLNTNTKRIHFPWCNSVSQMKTKNKWAGHFSRSELIANGYVPCGKCNP